ncbi:MAG: LPS export ABC transporter ATP-binding protein [Gammaproteobacteria bacterium]|nr:LPS export ABC transporter ATP-binding protein [Gammaproteobacteria bacterium]
MNILSATQLAKAYKGREVVKSVSLEVKEGEIIGLLGPNGAGKTTCFYMIVGLIQHDKGEILINEQKVGHLPIHKRAHLGIGYLPQEASVFRALTVKENILAILQLNKKLKKKDHQQHLKQLLDDFQIQHIGDTQGMALSGGERRRVEIARALAAQPKFILLDEPFAGVDPISVVDIQSIIRQLADRDIGVLITDHNVRETLGICEKSYVMGEGEIICKGDKDQVLSNKKVKKFYLGEKFTL